MRVLLRAIALLAAPAIAQEGEPAQDPTCPQGELQTPRLPGSVCIGRTTPSYTFSAIYPREIAELPALVRLIRADARRSEAWIGREGRRWARERAAAGNEVFPLSYDQRWRLDAAAPSLIAASANIQHYTGGAHGGIEYRAILLDRRSGRRIGLGALFANLRPVQAAFCAAVRRAVGERLDNGREPLCPALASLPVTLAAGETGQVRALTVLIAPYVIGSWAEGPYEIELPLTDDLRALVRPRYRRAF